MILSSTLVSVSLLPCAIVVAGFGQHVKRDDAPEFPIPVAFEVSLERQSFEAR